MQELEPLLKSPLLALYLQKIKEVLAHEQELRATFYLSEAAAKTEFINGKVVLQPPFEKRHADVNRRLLTLLSLYAQCHSLGTVSSGLLVSLSRNDYAPDVLFFRQEVAQTLQADAVTFPTPDFIAEILAPATKTVDRGIKLDDYAAHGVREYWLVDPEEETLEQYLLEGDSYRLRMKSGTGVVKSTVIGGGEGSLELPVRALFDDEENLRVLKDLLR